MLPKNLKYGGKVESAVARSFRTNIAPQNGTGPYTLGDTIIINIPTRANLVLATTESYLKFRCAITSQNAGNNFRLDTAGIHTVIQRIRVFSGSNLLEDIDSYGMLAKMMFDLQVSTDSTYGKYNATSGTRNDVVAFLPGSPVPGSITVAAPTLGVAGVQANSGELVGTVGSANGTSGQSATVVGVGQTVSDTYCINLISLVGSLCSSNYFPLFACSSAPLRVEIQLVGQMQNFVNQAVSTVANTMAITNCEYIAQFIELGDEAMRGVYGALGSEPMQLVMPEYRNYQYNAQLISNTQTQINMPIPAKFSSLKSLLIACRDKGTGATTFFPTSSVAQGIQQYQFRLGSQVVPSKPPDTLQEMFEEVIKAVGSISDLQHSPSIEKFSYSLYNSTSSTIGAQPLGSNANFFVSIDAPPTAGSLFPTASSISNNNSGSFYVGLDLENYCAASKDGIFSGYNSNTDDIFWVPTFQTVIAGNPQMRFDAFACFDQVVIFQDNTAFVKF
jgi:hypothetical protein